MNLPQYTVLLPAYGRDYTSAAKVKADWEANKDFIMASTGQYTSCLDQAVGTTVELRYRSQRSGAMYLKKK